LSELESKMQEFVSDLVSTNFPLLMTALQSAKYLGIGKTKFFELVDQGKIVPVDIGGTRMYRRADLEKYVANLKPRR